MQNKPVFRFANVLMRVVRNFWTETDENRHYLSVYMIFEVITMQLPKVCFALPKIEKILKECERNKSKYLFWDQGKFHEILRIFR